jgi:hypothetical protein
VQQFGFQSPTSWVAPPTVTSVLVQAWGGGGGGGGDASTDGGGGGGGGEYAQSQVSVTPGNSYAIAVGKGGVGGDSATQGGNTTFGSTTVVAVGGSPGASSTGAPAGGAGGTGGTGSILNNGGTGGSGFNGGFGGGGGGGGAGTSTTGGTGGNGGNNVSGTAGAAGSSLGGAGGAGGNGSGGGAAGKPFGGGGGGGDAINKAGQPGAPGFLQLTYTTNQNPQPTSTDLVNPFNAVNYSNESVNDGDYFIQTGSQYTIQVYKSVHQNNTDNIAFTWIGRSTLSTLISPILIQIYNQNSTSWQTLATINMLPADTDSNAITVTQTSNLSNYYDSNNTVYFRSYQQVV